MTTPSLTDAPDTALRCRVYRCSRQDEMYVYLRADLDCAELPAELRQRTGHLTQVMELDLSRRRRLARVDVAAVSEQLRNAGWYLQLPPRELVNPHLHFGD